MSEKLLEVFKEKFTIKLLLLSVLIFPIALLVGSAVINSVIVLMNIFFLIHIISKKNYTIFNNHIFYFLVALWFFLILNTLMNDNFIENYSRSFGFIRFIILVFSFSYIFSYKNQKFKKLILRFWSIIFFIVAADIIFEFFYGFNTLGLKSSYDGRLVGFMGDQLKIGHWFLCFSLIILSRYFNKDKKLIFIVALSLIVSFAIGERANFIRLFLGLTFFLLITRILKPKILVSLIFIFVLFIYLAIKFDKSDNNALKYRYFDQVADVLKMTSLQEINNNNPYTPLYINAYTLFKKNIFLGVGTGSYPEESQNNFRSNNQIKGYTILPNTHPHQYHFELLATLGLPGYLFIITFLLYFLIKSFRFYINQKNYINLSSSLFILVFLIPLLPTGSFFTTYGASMFWLNFSLMNLGNFKNMN
jgi:oligosaccharide repeat unit polymerase